MTRLPAIRRTNLVVLEVIALLVATAQPTLAQIEATSSDAREQLYQPVSPYPVEMGFSQDHSSTAYEGAQRGRAAVIQAWGNYQLSQSQAQVIRQQARALNRENDLKQTEALNAQKNLWDKARADARARREMALGEGRRKADEKRATVYRKAYQLASDEFDPTTGTINWPAALLDVKYEPLRTRVDELFRTQIAYHDPKPANAQESLHNIGRLRRALLTVRSQMPREQYLNATRFLLGLQLEAESLAQAS